MTFNTKNDDEFYKHFRVLSFKPCYKWMTFNTSEREVVEVPKEEF